MTSIEILLRKSSLYPALSLEQYFSARKRQYIIKITKYLLYSIPLIIIIGIIFEAYSFSSINSSSDILLRKITGLMFMTFGLYILMHMFEAYFSSIYYFERVGKNLYQENEIYTFSVGRILRRSTNGDILVGFLRSKSIGQNILLRLGIDQKEINYLLLKQAELKQIPLFNPQTHLIKVVDIVDHLYERYPYFQKMLTYHGIDKKSLIATVNWVIYQVESLEYDRQWWVKEKLARIPGVATDWSFGRTYLLKRYSRQILDDEEVNSRAINFSTRERELSQLQSILSRQNGAAALIIGQPGQEKMEVIWNLARQIRDKTASPALIGKKPILFLATDFTSTIKEKNALIKQIQQIFEEALQAGNVILIIDNLPRLIIEANKLELNLADIMEPYFKVQGNQIIALADTEYFHTLIENNSTWMSHFETVITKTLQLEEIVKIIAREALEVEKKYELIYTYPAILEIAKSAEYYFPNGVSSDKARDLLTELSPWAVENSISIVNKDNVLKYVGEKTNIPLANISGVEKDQLLNLENLLMKRVIAQREAVFAVANALRRSRAGIRNEKRPIGSFLFLGPTGVGKTETAKALAEVFFGDEKLLLRLDMSEYQDDNAISQLIGSQSNNYPGVLVNILKEHPYGVLLLDEFEKTNHKVLNLFLQIIDEGYFTDAFGKKIMARNILFIATSNAGAEKIFDLVSRGEHLPDYENDILNHIIQTGIFKPELINRFDATILFHPLSKENLVDIARLMIQKVAKRLTEMGIILKIDNELINFIVGGGYNPSFGARPMNRFIQDTIEQHLADAIIRNQINAGQTINFKILDEKNNKNSLKLIIQ